MATQVIKADGSKQPFDEGKLRRSIEAAARDANLPEQRVEEVAAQVFRTALDAAGGKEEIATSEIKETILNELDRVEPLVAEAWRAYDRGRGKG